MNMPEMPNLLLDIVQAQISRLGLPDRQVHQDDFWCHVDGSAPAHLVQGWKLHLSATPLSAAVVLHAAADVLLRSGCPFKFAKDLARVTELTSGLYDRAQAGKFITAYPANEEEFHRLAIALCDITAGMPGPRILSDRQYRPGSIVQYRYGAFLGVPVLTNDGSFETWLQDPQGNAVTDPRKPWFTPPSWITPIEPRGARPAGRAETSRLRDVKSTRPMLADGRFEVVRALRHSARGGVYQATDTKTGYPVLIKEARAHIGSDLRGQDSRALLGYESKVLAELSPLTPSLVCLFDQDDHSFLVEEFVEGQSLSGYITDLARARKQVPQPGTVALALVTLVDAVHRRGWVLRDLSSSNVMITPARKLVLIDPEHAARHGEIAFRVFTPGFAAPEALDVPPAGAAADPAVDRFAVGAILVHLLLGSPVCHIEGEDDARHSVFTRICRLLELAERERPLVRQWRPLLTGLCEPDPGSRWALTQAVDFLERHPAVGHAVAPRTGNVVPASTAGQAIREVLDGGFHYLASTMRPDADWLWKPDALAASSDPLNVQEGVAGMLALLVRGAACGYSRAADALPLAAEWTQRRLEQVPRILPGLHFGRAGTAWALREAADELGDEDMAARAEEFGLRLPLRWPNPDVCHGTAGAGLAQLRLWQLSGREEFLDRARDCADGLLAEARRTADGVFWPVPEDFDSILAGAWHLGFAHGVAGVGAFLLAAGQACGDSRYLEMANAAGQTLAAAADLDPATGSATWRADRQRGVGGDTMLFHWCNGASGVGSFLVRLAAAQSEPATADRYRHLVGAAAAAVHAARWISPNGACHGVAGNGQFLLDASAAARQAGSLDAAARYRQWAEDLAQIVMARRGVLGGRTVIPGEFETEVTPGYGTGLAGVLDFLLRLQHGGRRPWMVEFF